MNRDKIDIAKEKLRIITKDIDSIFEKYTCIRDLDKNTKKREKTPKDEYPERYEELTELINKGENANFEVLKRKAKIALYVLSDITLLADESLSSEEREFFVVFRQVINLLDDFKTKMWQVIERKKQS